MEIEEKQSLKESIIEVLAIAKTCLTTFWFWVPSIFALYIYFQLYLMTINPLLLVIGPAIIIVYALIWEEKRLKAQYGIKDFKVLRSSDPLFAAPRKVTQDIEIEQLVEEYERLIEKPDKKPKSTVENTD